MAVEIHLFFHFVYLWSLFNEQFYILVTSFFLYRYIPVDLKSEPQQIKMLPPHMLPRPISCMLHKGKYVKWATVLGIAAYYANDISK